MVISFTIPDDQVQRFVAAQAFKFGYQETVNGQPNPETKAQFIRRMQRQVWTDDIVKYEGKQAADSAFRTAAETAKAQISIT